LPPLLEELEIPLLDELETPLLEELEIPLLDELEMPLLDELLIPLLLPDPPPLLPLPPSVTSITVPPHPDSMADEFRTTGAARSDRKARRPLIMSKPPKRAGVPACRLSIPRLPVCATRDCV
jgi:hypothetical protein